MDEMNDKLKERWQQRRKKSHNWTKLIIMVAALVGILWAMGEMQKSTDKLNWTSTPEIVDTLSTPTVPADSTP